MRLFVAVTPPVGVLAELDRAVRPLAGAVHPGRLRWTEPAGWHVTLAFLGEVEAATLPDLSTRLERAARRHTPVRLRLAGGGRFATVLWAGVYGDVSALTLLATSVGAAARRAGVTVEERRFRPHLTLARARSGGAPADLALAAAGLDDFVSASWTAARMELLRTHPPAPGVPGARPRYEVLSHWPLAGG